MNGRTPRRGLLGVLAAVMLVVTAPLAACGSSNGGGSGCTQTIRFVWWGNQDRANATNKAIALFEKRNPNIHVQTEFSGYAAYVQKLTTEIAGGAAPDLIQLDRATFGEYEHKHVLLDLSSEQSTLRTSSIADNLLSGGRADGGLYAVPGGQTAQMVAYDPALFARAGVSVPSTGWTWPQFTTDMAKVGAATGEPGTTDFGWAVDWFDSWLHQRGKAAVHIGRQTGLHPDRPGTVLEPHRASSGSTRASARRRPPRRWTAPSQNSAMVTKQAASEFNYDSNLTSYISSYGGPVAAAPLPSDGTSAKDSGMAALPPVYYAVPKMSAHRDAAVKLLDFLVNDPDAGKILGTTRGAAAELGRAQVGVRQRDRR